jgi:hypothetical protein
MSVHHTPEERLSRHRQRAPRQKMLTFYEWRVDMPLDPAFQPLVALIAGILILMIPRLLNFIVAIYLIVVGVLGLLHRAM